VRATVSNGILTVTGTSNADSIAVRLRPGDPNVVEVDVGADGSADFSFDRSTFTAITVDGKDGDDLLVADPSGGTFTDTEATTLDGGAGNDTLRGGNGPEQLLGGGGADVIDGNQGADAIDGGGGADTVIWDPGDGSDIVVGGAGSDKLAFNGANIAEVFDVSASGTHVVLTRNIANIVIDLSQVETIDLRALGGADVLTVNDLTGTGLTQINVDLSATLGGPDLIGDSVIVNGTSGNDVIKVGDDGGEVVVKGLAATVRVGGVDATLDTLTVNGLDGADSITSSVVAQSLMVLQLVP